MPRPPVKRRKPNKQNSRSPSHSRRDQSNLGLTSAPRDKLQQRLANKAVGQRPQESDDSDRLVTRTRSGRPSRNFEQIFASGGVAKGDTPGSAPTKEQRRTRLRSDTEEIVRRSRSKSVEVAKERLSKSRSNSVASGNNTKVDTTPATVVVPNTQSQTSADAPTKAHPTTRPETSILGSLKPRKRQASILHLIDVNDSSTINPEDEEQFLPDDESTPLNALKQGGKQKASRVSTSSVNSASRKRKFGADETVLVSSTPLAEVATTTTTTTPTPEDSMSNPPRSSRQQIASTHDDDEIMAPPQSSSPEGSPQRSRPPTPAKSKKSASVPTTEQLQSLMPSKRRKGARQRNQATEFDIPEDSDSMNTNGIEDDSVFLPAKRATKLQGKKDLPNKNSKSKVNENAKNAASGGVATPARKSKQSSKSTSTPLKVTTPRTPLPLTRNANQENKSLNLSRSRNPNSKPNGAVSGMASTTKPTSTRKGLTNAKAKQSGGFLHPTGAENDKENSGIVGRGTTRANTRSSAKHTSPTTLNPATQADLSETEGVQPSIEDVDSQDDMMDVDAEVEVEVRRSGRRKDAGSVQVVDETPPDEIERAAASVDVKAWKDKWGDIDNWNLDYEEVDISTGSDSPLRVSVV